MRPRRTRAAAVLLRVERLSASTRLGIERLRSGRPRRSCAARSSAWPASAATGRTNSSACVAGLAVAERGRDRARRSGPDRPADARCGAAAGIGYRQRRSRGRRACASPRRSATISIAGRHREPRFSRSGLLRRGAIDAHEAAAARPLRGVLRRAPADRRKPFRRQPAAPRHRARARARAEAPASPAQPTRGVDIAGTAFIHQACSAFRDRGGAVLLVSEELEEMLALSDRIVVHLQRADRRRNRPCGGERPQRSAA